MVATICTKQSFAYTFSKGKEMVIYMGQRNGTISSKQTLTTFIILEVHRTTISPLVPFKIVVHRSTPNSTAFVSTTRIARLQDLNKKS